MRPRNTTAVTDYRVFKSLFTPVDDGLPNGRAIVAKPDGTDGRTATAESFPETITHARARETHTVAAGW